MALYTRTNDKVCAHCSRIIPKAKIQQAVRKGNKIFCDKKEYKEAMEVQSLKEHLERIKSKTAFSSHILQGKPFRTIARAGEVLTPYIKALANEGPGRLKDRYDGIRPHITVITKMLVRSCPGTFL